jgi:alkyl sulfatase BDS1-like metallo-beta-lactamase superfamily hydrolase
MTPPRPRPAALASLIFFAVACDSPPPAPTAAPAVTGVNDPTPATATAQRAVAASLPLEDRQDFEDANRGLVGREAQVAITAADGHVVWQSSDFAFATGEAPASVNPSLWRQAQLNNVHGLFQVADGLYQVRGYDVSNMSLIRGQSGWIIVDPLTCKETATAALALAATHLGPITVSAVILTHSHADHFGGIEAVLPTDPGLRAGLRIVAPKGFVEEATSENVLAGVTMGRRAGYMYGLQLPKSARGHVTTGLGQAPARGDLGLVLPSEFVDHTPQPLTIDGVRFVFQYTPESEAPAEMAFHLPDHRAYCGAEIVSHTMHNLYTLRGAKVRDALKWSGYIHQALALFSDTDVVFGSHNWPVWGRERVVGYLERQRDAYKYIHDQTLRLASQGLTSQEVAEAIEMPAALARDFAVRGYYGTVRHNAKAVYQAYFGWFDGNPANLDPLPPEPAAVKYVEAMGGADAVLAKGHAAFDAGDYRWAATLLNHLVFAQPTSDSARALLARVYDQLGYQAESGPWRDFYLTGALELRQGAGTAVVDPRIATTMFRRMPADRFFDLLATRVVGPKADGTTVTLNFIFTDLDESYVVTLKNAVLNHSRRAPDPGADATIRLTKEFMVRLVTQQVGPSELLTSSELDIDGSRTRLLSFLSVLDRPEFAFAIVTP